MKFLIALALVAVVAADVSHLSNEYLPPVQTAPVQQQFAAPAPQHFDAPAPVPHHFEAPIAQEYEALIEEPAPAHTFGADGYNYKAPARAYRRRYRF